MTTSDGPTTEQVDVPYGSARRPRLCMILHGPYPVGETRVLRESAAALARGWEVDVVAMKRAGDPSREIVEGARVWRLPTNRGTRSGLIALAREYVGFSVLATLLVAKLHLTRRYDVVQIHNPPDFLVIAGLLPRLFGARMIVDVHDFAPELFLLRHPSAKGTRVERLLDLTERAALRLADSVVTVHAPYERALIKKGVPKDAITVVMNSLDESLLPPRPAPRDPGFVVMHHGTMNAHYGIDVLVNAFASLGERVPAALLELRGRGDVVPEIQRLVHDLGLDDRVHLVGEFVPQREVLAQVPRASVGVVANLAIERNLSVLPVKLLEYVALRVPVVASDLPGIREYFSDEEILFYPAGNAGALADALFDVARNPDAAARRAEAALKRYAEHRWHVYAERYGDLLRGLTQ